MEILNNYGNQKKKVCFEAVDGDSAKLIIKLRHHRLGQGEFFRSLMRAYCEDHPLLDDFFEEYKKTKKNYSAIKESKLKKEREQARELEKKFALDQNEIDDIYDLFEEEEGDYL